MIVTLKYAALVLKHKWFVFLAGLKTKAPIWRLLLHDMSKFLPAEMPHYTRQFFGDADDPIGFVIAWNHHQKINKHHWEYWVPVTDTIFEEWEDLKPLPIPEKYIREMLADWLGASRTYNGTWPDLDNWKWFNENFNKIKLHYDTRLFILSLIDDLKSSEK